MNKKDIINEVAETTKYSKAQVEKCFDEIINQVEKALLNDEKINVLGFGSLSLVTKKERTGFNPITRESLKIPSKKTVKFTVGKTLKEKLNK